MRSYLALLCGAAWLMNFNGALAQTNSIETPENLKDSTQRVVVERQVYEKKTVYQKDTPQNVQRKVVIIAENRADAVLNDKVSVLEDLVAAKVAGQGFTVVSRDVAVNSLKKYESLGVSAEAKTVATVQGTSGAGLASAQAELGRADSAKIAVTPEIAKLDQALSDNTSALRLAQNLGVDYLLVPSIAGYGTEKKNYTGNGVQTLNITHRLRVSYKLAEANEGGTVKGGSFVSQVTHRDTANLQVENSDMLNELLEDAASQLANAIVAGAKTLPAEVARTGMVTFNISCSMTDPRQQPITLPAIGIQSSQSLVTNPPVSVQPLDVTVELDGVAIGSAPGEFKARPGLHKLRLSREGFSNWERTINVFEGQTLNVALQMSPEGYAKWRDTTAFLSRLDNTRKLTDAEVKQIEGVAEFFRNSHYRVDTKDNIQINKSLY